MSPKAYQPRISDPPPAEYLPPTDLVTEGKIIWLIDRHPELLALFEAVNEAPGGVIEQWLDLKRLGFLGYQTGLNTCWMGVYKLRVTKQPKQVLSTHLMGTLRLIGALTSGDYRAQFITWRLTHHVYNALTLRLTRDLNLEQRSVTQHHALGLHLDEDYRRKNGVEYQGCLACNLYHQELVRARGALRWSSRLNAEQTAAALRETGLEHLKLGMQRVYYRYPDARAQVRLELYQGVASLRFPVAPARYIIQHLRETGWTWLTQRAAWRAPGVLSPRAHMVLEAYLACDFLLLV